MKRTKYTSNTRTRSKQEFILIKFRLSRLITLFFKYYHLELIHWDYCFHEYRNNNIFLGCHTTHFLSFQLSDYSTMNNIYMMPYTHVQASVHLLQFWHLMPILQNLLSLLSRNRQKQKYRIWINFTKQNTCCIHAAVDRILTVITENNSSPPVYFVHFLLSDMVIRD